MSYNQYQNNDPQTDPNWNPIEHGAPHTPSQTFAMLSVVFAILGLATFLLVFTPVFFGALAIIFALLSRGNNPRLARPATAAIPLGTASIALGIGLIIFGLYTITTQFGSFENFYSTIMQQAEMYSSGNSGTLDMSQFMENFGGY